LEAIRLELERTLGQVTNWVPGTDETQELQDGDSIHITFQPELVLITGSSDHTAKIMSFHGEATETIVLPDSVHKVAFSPDRNHFAISYGSRFHRDRYKLFSDSDKRCRTFLFPPLDCAHIFTFSPDGKWMVNPINESFQNSERLLRIFSVDNQETPALVLRGQALEFSPDNKRIAFVSMSQEVHIIEDMGGKTLRKIQPPENTAKNEKSPLKTWGVRGMSFSYDGKLLAINYLTEIQITNIQSGELVKKIEIPGKNKFYEVLFSPSGNYLVTLDTFYGLRFWKASDSISDFPEKTIDENDIENLYDSMQIAFDPTGQYLAIPRDEDVCIVDTFPSASLASGDHVAWKISYFYGIHRSFIMDLAFGYRNAWTRAILSIEKHVQQQDNQ